MKVKITSDTLPRVVFELAGDYQESADRFAPSFRNNIESLAFLRGTGIEPVSRGNKTVDISFGMMKTFSDAVDCALFCLDLQSNVPETGRVVITVTGANSSKGERIIEHAAITEINATPIGVKAVITFHVIGGLITKTPVGSPTS